MKNNIQTKNLESSEEVKNQFNENTTNRTDFLSFKKSALKSTFNISTNSAIDKIKDQMKNSQNMKEELYISSISNLIDEHLYYFFRLYQELLILEDYIDLAIQLYEEWIKFSSSIITSTEGSNKIRIKNYSDWMKCVLILIILLTINVVLNECNHDSEISNKYKVLFDNYFSSFNQTLNKIRVLSAENQFQNFFENLVFAVILRLSFDNNTKNHFLSNFEKYLIGEEYSSIILDNFKNIQKKIVENSKIVKTNLKIIDKPINLSINSNVYSSNKLNIKRGISEIENEHYIKDPNTGKRSKRQSKKSIENNGLYQLQLDDYNYPCFKKKYDNLNFSTLPNTQISTNLASTLARYNTDNSLITTQLDEQNIFEHNSESQNLVNLNLMPKKQNNKKVTNNKIKELMNRLDENNKKLNQISSNDTYTANNDNKYDMKMSYSKMTNNSDSNASYRKDLNLNIAQISNSKDSKYELEYKNSNDINDEFSKLSNSNYSNSQLPYIKRNQSLNNLDSQSSTQVLPNNSLKLEHSSSRIGINSSSNLVKNYQHSFNSVLAKKTSLRPQVNKPNKGRKSKNKLLLIDKILSQNNSTNVTKNNRRNSMDNINIKNELKSSNNLDSQTLTEKMKNIINKGFYNRYKEFSATPKLSTVTEIASKRNYSSGDKHNKDSTIKKKNDCKNNTLENKDSTEIKKFKLDENQDNNNKNQIINATENLKVEYGLLNKNLLTKSTKTNFNKENNNNFSHSFTSYTQYFNSLKEKSEKIISNVKEKQVSEINIKSDGSNKMLDSSTNSHKKNENKSELVKSNLISKSNSLAKSISSHTTLSKNATISNALIEVESDDDEVLARATPSYNDYLSSKSLVFNSSNREVTVSKIKNSVISIYNQVNKNK